MQLSAAAVAETQTDRPRPVTELSMHETVVRLLDQEPRGVLLDAPAGEGHLAEELASRGFKVHAVELNMDQVRGRLAHYQSADLNKDVPFADEFFDYITCVESIEHLEHPHHLVRELYRVLKPAGKLIITTPNVMNVESRLQFLFLGWPTHFEHWVYRPPSAPPLNFHINPISYLELRKILCDTGFAIEQVTTNRFLRRRWLWAPLAGLVRWWTNTWLRRHEVTGFREVLSAEVLFGKLLVIKAVKRKPEVAHAK
jgi:2-polyprenyl-3-methyl-5-hydroxy-6-metoxy-1,4-benzoquinol methylase